MKVDIVQSHEWIIINIFFELTSRPPGVTIPVSGHSGFIASIPLCPMDQAQVIHSITRKGIACPSHY